MRWKRDNHLLCPDVSSSLASSHSVPTPREGGRQMDFVFRSGAQLSFLTVASPSRNFTLWTSLAVFLWVTPQADPETSIWVKWFTWDLVSGSIAWWVWGVSKTNSRTRSYRDLPETAWGTSLDCSAAGWGAGLLVHWLPSLVDWGLLLGFQLHGPSG